MNNKYYFKEHRNYIVKQIRERLRNDRLLEMDFIIIKFSVKKYLKLLLHISNTINVTKLV